VIGASLLIVFSSTSASRAAEVTCYVDSLGGCDTKPGLSESEAVSSQSKIDPTCTIVRYKRGSVFNEKLSLTDSATTYGNYGDAGLPLPAFMFPRQPRSGPVFDGTQRKGLTVDGSFLSGSTGDGTVTNVVIGTCVVLGAGGRLINSKVTDCDIGAQLLGEGSQTAGNYIHDIRPSDSLVSLSSLPPIAWGLLLSGTKHDVSYNSFVGCKSTIGAHGAKDCSGSAIQIVIPACGTMSGTSVHHNFARDSCGFLDISSVFGDCRGNFSDVLLFDNVLVDSGWLALLEIENTDFAKTQVFNNTIVQHKNSLQAGFLFLPYITLSAQWRDLPAGAVFLTNNLFVLDGFAPLQSPPLHKNIVQATNLIVNSATGTIHIVD
jgi:hypothetical protein